MISTFTPRAYPQLCSSDKSGIHLYTGSGTRYEAVFYTQCRATILTRTAVLYTPHGSWYIQGGGVGTHRDVAPALQESSALERTSHSHVDTQCFLYLQTLLNTTRPKIEHQDGPFAKYSTN